MTTLSTELAPEFWEQSGTTPDQINSGDIPRDLFTRMRTFMHDHVAIEPVAEQLAFVAPVPEVVL